jgi:hypothetical protein
MITEN